MMSPIPTQLLRRIGPAAVAILLLVVFSFGLATAPPQSLDTTIAGAQIQLEAERAWVLLPGDCVTVTWQVSGVEAVYFNGQGVTGEDSQTACSVHSQPHTLRITLPGGSGRSVILPVGVALLDAANWWTAALIAGLLALSVYLYTPAPRKRYMAAVALLLGSAALLSFILLQLAYPTALFIHTATDNQSVFFSTDRTWMLWSPRCTEAAWQVDGVESLQINGEGMIGAGEHAFCDETQSALTLSLTPLDGEPQSYTLKPTALLISPVGWLMGSGIIGLAIAAAFTAFPTWMAAHRRGVLSLLFGAGVLGMAFLLLGLPFLRPETSWLRGWQLEHTLILLTSGIFALALIDTWRPKAGLRIIAGFNLILLIAVLLLAPLLTNMALSIVFAVGALTVLMLLDIPWTLSKVRHTLQTLAGPALALWMLAVVFVYWAVNGSPGWEAFVTVVDNIQQFFFDFFRG